MKIYTNKHLKILDTLPTIKYCTADSRSYTTKKPKFMAKTSDR